MDNFSFNMVCAGRETLKKALSLFPQKDVIGYRIDSEKGMILYWAECENCIKLPFPMDLEQAAHFVYGWLEHTDFGDAPDHDGSNSKGWRLYNESWGHIGHEWQTFAAVLPVWAMHGK